MGAIAFAMLIASAGLSFGQTQQESTTLADIRASGGLSATLTEPVGAETDLILTITDATWNFPPEQVTLTEPPGTNPSDRILFRNDTSNNATITFLSDDGSGNLASGFPILPESTTAVTEDFEWKRDFVALPGGGFMQIDMISDVDGVTNHPILGSASDGLFLQIVPEPSTLFMAALGLASLVGIAYRRAHLAKVL